MKKDNNSMKAHVLANLPEEYKPAWTGLYINQTFNYEDYKKYIRNYRYTELGFKDIIKYSTSETDSRKFKEGGDSIENILNTTMGGFPFRYRMCGKRCHEAQDCKTPVNERQKFEGNCNWCGKIGTKSPNVTLGSGVNWRQHVHQVQVKKVQIILRLQRKLITFLLVWRSV